MSTATTWNSGASTDANNAANYSAGLAADAAITLDATSVVNWIFTANMSVDSVTIAAAYSGVVTLTGFGLTVNLNGAAFSDHGITGAHSYGNYITATGASATVEFHSASTVIATSCVITMSGTTGMSLTDNKGVAFSSLVLGASAIVTNGGAVTSTYASATSPLTFTNGGTLTINRAMNFDLSADAAYVTITAGAPTINGIAILSFRVKANNVDATMPTFTRSGTGALYFLTSGTYTNCTVTFNGTVTANALRLFVDNANSSVTYLLNGQTFSLSSFDWGSTSATGTCVITCGASPITISGAVGASALHNNGTCTLTLNSSTWSIGTSYTALSGATYTTSTDVTTFIGTGTITCNAKTPFYDVILNHAGATTTTLGGAFACSGDFLVSAGSFTMATYVATVGIDFTWNSAGTWLGNSAGDGLTMTGNSGILTINNIGTITPTSTTLIMSGTTNMTIVNAKSNVTFLTLTVSASAIVTFNSSATIKFNNAGFPLTVGLNATLTITNFYVIFERTNAGDLYSLPAAYTFNGAGYVAFKANGTAAFTAPACTFTGAGFFRLIFGASVTATITLTGAISATSGTAAIYCPDDGGTYTFGTGNYAISAAIFLYGNNSLNSTIAFNFGSSIITTTGAVNSTLYDGAASTINLSSSTWNIGGSYTALTLGTYTVGTASTTITGTSTLTSNGKTWNYDLTINCGANTVTMADALVTAAGGALTLTAGTLNTATFAVTVGANFSVNGTSTYTGTSTALIVSGNIAIDGTATFTINLSTLLLNAGAGTQAITSNGQAFPATTHNGAGGTVQIQDTVAFGTLTLTAGAFDMNGQNLSCTTFTWNTIDAATTLDGDITCTGNITRGAASAGTQPGETIITGNSSITCNAQRWGNISINGALITATCADAFYSMDLTLTAGTFTAAGFAQDVLGNLTVNGTSIYTVAAAFCTYDGNMTLAATCTLNALAAIFTFNGDADLTTGGIALPFCVFNNNHRIHNTCTINRLNYGLDGSTLTFDAGDIFTITALAAADWDGAVGALNTFRSSITGTAFTLVLPNAVTVSRVDVRDCTAIGFAITASDGTSITQGGNIGWDFGFALAAAAYAGGVISTTMTAGGVNQYPVSDVGYRLTGGGAFTSGVITAWDGDAGSATAALAAGTYDVQVISSDGVLSAVLVAALVVGAGGGVATTQSRISLGIGIGL